MTDWQAVYERRLSLSTRGLKITIGRQAAGELKRGSDALFFSSRGQEPDLNAQIPEFLSGTFVQHRERKKIIDLLDRSIDFAQNFSVVRHVKPSWH
jgi:hypothetical protein